VTDPVFPPVNLTVPRSNVTEVIETTPLVPPAPADPSQVGTLQSVEASPGDAPTSGSVAPSAG
jgi:hypothetical protein